MKNRIVFVLCCMLLAGCAADTSIQSTPSATTEMPVPETTEPITTIQIETLPPEFPVDIYIPDENAESFYTIPYNISEFDASMIVAILVHENVLNDEIVLYSAELVGNQLNLDFNQVFLDQLCTYGTSGERMMIGCVVNTFLSICDAEYVFITVEGQIMESGHVIYDFPMGFFE